MSADPRSSVGPSAHHRRTPRAVLLVALSVVGFWAILVAAMLALERRFIYFPYRELVAAPADYGLRADEVRLVAADGVRLHGWWIHGDGARALVWFHGNAGNISHRLENARLLVDRFGLAILLVDYRGYGLSDGEPDEPGLYLDGEAMYREAAARRRPDDIVLFGRSLGAAVAVEMALRHPVGAVILETPFLSVPAMARAVYPFIPSFLIRTQFDSETKIAGVAPPKLILHGDRDEIVPIAQARRLFELAHPPKRFYVVRGASHNDTYLVGGPAYFEAWRQFLEETRK